MADYINELEALQTWIKEKTGLGSWRLAEMPPKLVRPVIVFEAPSRVKAREVGHYQYVMKVRQYGKLYVKSTDRLAEIQEQLFKGLEDQFGVLLFEGNYLKQIEIEFTETDSLDVPFSIEYEATYNRPRPVDPPPATFVGTKITTDIGG